MYDNKKIIEENFGSLVGKTILGVRPLTDEEAEDMCWDTKYQIPFAIIFTDGSWMMPSSDPEGNQPGHLFLSGEEDE
jgi:hypothetical protein